MHRAYSLHGEHVPLPGYSPLNCALAVTGLEVYRSDGDRSSDILIVYLPVTYQPVNACESIEIPGTFVMIALKRGSLIRPRQANNFREVRRC